jgi:hypothetical protein
VAARELSRAGMITKFDLCKFSYGYSRVENGPKVKKHDRWMPVRVSGHRTISQRVLGHAFDVRDVARTYLMAYAIHAPGF